ncbi:MAG: hypothetical protein AAF449_18650, partial [Myxococcota bacterium]
AWPVGGLYSYREGVVELISRVIFATAMTQTEDALFMAGNELLRIEKNGLGINRKTLLFTATGVTALEDRVLVSMQATGETIFRAVNPNSLLAEIDEIRRPGVVTGLTTTSSLAIATMSNPPRLLIIDRDLNTVDVPMSSFTDLGVADVVPSTPHSIEPGRVTFVADCHASAGKKHCVYDFDLDSRTVTDRIGVPDESMLMSLVADGSSLWLGGVMGVHRAYLNPLRPEPSDYTTIEHGVAAVVVADGTEGPRLLALASRPGEITILSPTP